MLIRPATVRRLEKRLRPDYLEGTVKVGKKVRVPDGAGKKEVLQFRGTYPARLSFESYMRSREEQVAGRPGGNHRYLIELPAYTEVWASDFLVYTAPAWQANNTYRLGEYVIPLVENGHVYQAQNGGTSGATQPMFQPVLNSYVSDNGIEWRATNRQLMLEVIEVAQVDSFELVRDVYCDLRE